MYTGTKPLQTIFVQMAIQTHWLSFRKKQTWYAVLDFSLLGFFSYMFSLATCNLCCNI